MLDPGGSAMIMSRGSFQEAVRESNKRDADTQTAVVGSGAHSDLGIQSCSKRADDGQSQAAAYSALIAVQPIESREDLLSFGTRDSGTVIFDIDHMLAVLVEESDDNTAAGLVVADRVVDQIGEYL